MEQQRCADFAGKLRTDGGFRIVIDPATVMRTAAGSLFERIRKSPLLKPPKTTLETGRKSDILLTAKGMERGEGDEKKTIVWIWKTMYIQLGISEAVFIKG